MADKINIAIEKEKENLHVFLRKSFQSANINFLIGSGCSDPAIKTLGNVENDIQTLLREGKEDEAEKKMCDFLKPFVISANKLIAGEDESDNQITQNNYKEFLNNISCILTERKNNILPKQATIFTTNYGLFIEHASDGFRQTIKLNDGFNRNPTLNNEFRFSVSEFFNSIYNNGNLYNYQVEIPSINLIKLHGSLSWKRNEGDIIFSVDYLKKMPQDFPHIFSNDQNGDSNTAEPAPKLIKEINTQIRRFNDQFSIILPRKDKFQNTLLDRTYYDLLRVYANELDKENTLLIAEGFSFADEHIQDITKRALRNPTLRLIIFCHNESDIGGYEDKFAQYNNVDYVYHEDEALDFKKFNEILKDIIPDEAAKSEAAAEDKGAVDDQ